MLKTASGRELSQELLEALIGEAEAGFAPEQLRARRISRPLLGTKPHPRVQFRLDPATYEALIAHAQARHCGVSEVARLAVEQYLRDEARRDATADAPDARA